MYLEEAGRMITEMTVMNIYHVHSFRSPVLVVCKTHEGAYHSLRNLNNCVI
jgi:hypothetical protein